MKRSVADAATKHAIGSSPASEETGKGGLPMPGFRIYRGDRTQYHCILCECVKACPYNNVALGRGRFCRPDEQQKVAFDNGSPYHAGRWPG